MMSFDGHWRETLSRIWNAGLPLLAPRKNRRRNREAALRPRLEGLEPRQMLTVFQSFDGVIAPALPAGWTTATNGFITNAWVTQTGGSASTLNRVFIPDVDSVSDTTLTSPQFLLAVTNQRLIFDQSFNLDFDGQQYFDGGVLEISVAGSAFQDILAAGGSFRSGGYIGTISAGGNTPLPNRQAWSGNSNGFLTTVVDLPGSAIGQNVQLRWRLATDNVVGFDGWSIDNIRLTNFGPIVGSINETFDGVTAPALPGGWSQAATGLFPQTWGTVAGGADSGINRVFVADTAHTPGGSANNLYDSQLISPYLQVSELNRRLTFRQSFDFEFIGNDFFDGGVLEIAVDGGDFVDIVAAGGTFLTGGYNRILYNSSDNVLEARNAWGGNSNGYLTTTVELPASLVGKTVQYRWRMGTDNEGGKVGWSVDSVFTNDTDPDDQISEAPLTFLNSSTSENLSTDFDVDLFAFDVTVGQTIKFDLDAIGAGSVSDAVLRIFDALGSQLAVSDDDAGPAPEGPNGKEPFISFTFATGGRYYVGVSGYSNSGYNVNTGTGDSTGALTGSYLLNIGPAPNVSIAMADTALRAGETSLVTFTFSEAVTGFANADVTVENGSLSNVSTADGGVTFTATFTPNSNVTDATNLITVNNTGYTDGAGNAGTGTTNSPNYVIDTQIPTVTIGLADNQLKAGETSLVTFTFSEAVTGFANADVTVENGSLSNVSTADGGVTFTATLTPNSNVTDATNLITVNNTGYTDAVGNAGTGTTNSANYVIDTRIPTVSIGLSDNQLKTGETSLVTFTFSEAVTGFSKDDVTVQNGTLSAVSSSDGGVTYTATLTPNTNVIDATNILAVNNTGFADAAGNPGTGTSSSQNYTLDTATPTDIILSNTTVAENVPSALVGILSAVDTPTDTRTFTIAAGGNGELFAIVANELRVVPTGLDFEAVPNGQLIVNITVTDQVGASFSKMFTIQVTDANEAPILSNSGADATFNKKLKQPVSVFAQMTVSDPDTIANLAGGTLRLTANVSANPKGTKTFDLFDFPGIVALGNGFPQTNNGQITVEIQLSPTVTAEAIQTFLRGVKFSTKGAGLKQTTRTASITLTDSAGLSSTLQQTINVRKK